MKEAAPVRERPKSRGLAHHRVCRLLTPGWHMDNVCDLHKRRRWWADAPANDGYSFRRGPKRNPYGLRARGPKVQPMNIRITITMKFEIAVTVSGLAALLWLLS